MGMYTGSLSDSESESENDSGLFDKKEKKQLKDAMRDSPPPEQKALPPSTRPGPKEPTPGQAVEVFSDNADEGKFKETKEENYPINVQTFGPVTSKRDDRTPAYTMGNSPAIFKAEGNVNTREGYRPALYRAIEAPPVEEPAPGRVEELSDDPDAPGGAGGAPGGSGTGGAAGGSGAASGGGNAPPAV